MKQDFLVPVEPAIIDFKEHLKCHPRTILSARYGDGKSYFLNAFLKDENVKNEFVFITLYPVNYQVLENKDIFDIIKYDVLLQMGLQGMLEKDYEISSQEAFFYCMRTHGLDLLENLFDVASNIEGVSMVKAIGSIGKSATGVIKKIKDAVLDYKEYKQGDAAKLDKYLDTVDTLHIYEEDVITKIIQDNLKFWRRKQGNENKKVVLLFEDMDRIDPAHLFRILNIFSAHMDFSYKYGCSPDNTLHGNKFGVDNVVMVIHYENLQSIFSHFYGPDTCFEGYIHKFADKGKFVYSLKKEAVKYYYACLKDITNIPEDVLRLIINEDRLATKTIRELSNSLERVEEQRKEINGITQDIALLMACFRRLSMSDSEIISNLWHVIDQNKKLWMEYLYPYLIHFKNLEGTYLYLINQDGKTQGFSFEKRNEGLVIYGSNAPTEGKFYKIGQILNEVLSLVSK